MTTNPEPAPAAPEQKGMTVAEARVQVNDAILFIQNMFKEVLENLAQSRQQIEVLERALATTQPKTKTITPTKPDNKKK